MSTFLQQERRLEAQEVAKEGNGWKLTVCGKVIWESKAHHTVEEAAYNEQAPCQVRIEALEMWYQKASKELQ